MDSTNITRRELALGSAGAAAALAQGARRRPNILFVMVDEMRWDAMSCETHPVVATPNLDRLAKQGVRFANAYTVAPVCSPARTCVFTGRYADVHGVIRNAMPANPGEIFLPSILKHYGYHTAIAGKLHYVPREFDFGFDQFWSFTAEGPTPELGYMAYLEKKHGSRSKWPYVKGTCPWPDDPLGRDVGVFLYPEPDFETEWITDRSIDYLRSRREKTEPWFLFTSYLKPHSPSVEPKRYFE
ncbi:MAG: sulfatase family protein, partial [Bryobacteraceae bacterium]